MSKSLYAASALACLLMVVACTQPPVTPADPVEPTKVDPVIEPDAATGNVVARDEAGPGEAPARGGY